MRLQTHLIRRGRAFHFGQHAGLGMEESAATWPSDSLFAALVALLARREGAQAVEAWLQPFRDHTPPFLLTSTFPCVCPTEGEAVFLFPVPEASRLAQAELPPDLRPKDVKRVRFVSEALYRRLLAGEPLALHLPNARRIHSGAVAFAPEDWARLPGDLRREEEDLVLWKVVQRPRVTVGRADNRSNLFHVGAVHFREAAGLWFGVQWLDEGSPWREKWNPLLTDLGENGLGAERSAGYGSAEIGAGPALELPDLRPDAPWTTLSRYWPRDEAELAALHGEGAAYGLLTVSGWMDGEGQRRRPLHMLAEGGVFAPMGHDAPRGALADVHPVYRAKPNHNPVGHPVYRYGYALAVGYGGEA